MAPPPVPTAGFCPITPILLASFLSLPHFSLPDLPFTGSHLPTQLLALKSSSRWGTSPKYQHRVRSATHSKSRRSIEQVLGPSHGGFKEQKAHREKREQKVPEKVDGTGPLGGGGQGGTGRQQQWRWNSQQKEGQEQRRLAIGPPIKRAMRKH